jgi:hypothetical protein
MKPLLGARWMLVVAGLVAATRANADTRENAAADRHAVHTTRGVVKSLATDAIVVARPRGRGDITFKLPSSLHRNGTIAVGAVVSVRYEDQGDVHVALAVAVQRP